MSRVPIPRIVCRVMEDQIWPLGLCTSVRETYIKNISYLFSRHSTYLLVIEPIDRDVLEDTQI